MDLCYICEAKAVWTCNTCGSAICTNHHEDHGINNIEHLIVRIEETIYTKELCVGLINDLLETIDLSSTQIIESVHNLHQLIWNVAEKVLEKHTNSKTELLKILLKLEEPMKKIDVDEIKVTLAKQNLYKRPAQLNLNNLQLSFQRSILINIPELMLKTKNIQSLEFKYARSILDLSNIQKLDNMFSHIEVDSIAPEAEAQETIMLLARNLEEGLEPKQMPEIKIMRPTEMIEGDMIAESDIPQEEQVPPQNLEPVMISRPKFLDDFENEVRAIEAQIDTKFRYLKYCNYIDETTCKDILNLHITQDLFSNGFIFVNDAIKKSNAIIESLKAGSTDIIIINEKRMQIQEHIDFSKSCQECLNLYTSISYGDFKITHDKLFCFYCNLNSDRMI